MDQAIKDFLDKNKLSIESVDYLAVPQYLVARQDEIRDIIATISTGRLTHRPYVAFSIQDLDALKYQSWQEMILEVIYEREKED